MSSIIKKHNVTQLIKFYVENNKEDDETFSSLCDLITTKEEQIRQKEEEELNYYKSQTEKYKKEVDVLKSKIEDLSNLCDNYHNRLQKAEKELNEIKIKEQEIINNANQEANKILSQAKENEEKIRQDAYNQGYNDGFKKGEEEGLKIYLTKKEEFEKVIQSIQNRANDILNLYEHKLIQIVLLIAKHVVHKEIQIDQDIIKECLKKALDEIMDKSMIIIHINPEDYIMANEFINHEYKKYGNPEIVLSKDENIQRGGALVECKMGVIDLTMETKWQIIESILDKALQEKTNLSIYTN